jgi:hypothetical protein
MDTDPTPQPDEAAAGARGGATPTDSQLRRERDELREALLGAERDLVAMRQLEADLAEVRSLWDSELRDVAEDRDRWRGRYEAVVGSSSWRLTQPLRDLAERLRGPR